MGAASFNSLKVISFFHKFRQKHTLLARLQKKMGRVSKAAQKISSPTAYLLTKLPDFRVSGIGGGWERLDYPGLLPEYPAAAQQGTRTIQ
jgi:hypothetical protein